MYIAYIQIDVIMVYVTYIHTESLIENNGELFPPISTMLHSALFKQPFSVNNQVEGRVKVSLTLDLCTFLFIRLFRLLLIVIVLLNRFNCNVKPSHDTCIYLIKLNSVTMMMSRSRNVHFGR